MSDNYYTFWQQNLTQQGAENQCNNYGKHLASIDSASKMNLITETCQCDRCWIGLETACIRNAPKTYQWNDDSSINTSFINENWCGGYPKIYTYDIDTIYYTFIDKNSKCWKTTNDLSLELCSICGPKMFDTTNGLYFITNMIIPLILSLIGLIYSLCICKKLKKGLYSTKKIKNWVILPTKHMKRTSILASFVITIFCLFVIIYVIILYDAYEKTGILAPSSVIDDEYPNIYKTAAIFEIIIGIIYFIFIPIIYVHLLLRLKHSFNNNPVFRVGIPSKYKYNLMILLFIFYFLLPIIYIIIDAEMNDLNGWKDKSKIGVILLWMAVNIIINILLLYLYLKALYKFNEYSIKYNYSMNTMGNSTSINYETQSQHEMMIEFRRYTVSFGMILFINILTIILSAIFIKIIHGKKTEHDELLRYIINMICMILLCLKEFISLQCIYYSYNFNHIKYKKKCNCCDKWMKNKCHKMVVRRNEDVTLSKVTPKGITNKKDIDKMENDEGVPITAQHVRSVQNVNVKDQYNDIITRPISIDDYLPYNEHQTESHANIAEMQNAEDNVDAVNFIVD